MRPKIQPKKKGHLTEKNGEMWTAESVLCHWLTKGHGANHFIFPWFKYPLAKLGQQKSRSSTSHSAQVCTWWGTCVSWVNWNQSFQFTRKVCRDTSVFVNPCFIMFWHLEGQSRIVIVQMMTTVSLIKRKLKIGSGYNYHFGHHSIILNTVPRL